MEEIWKDISGYNGLYQVSNLGRVKSLANNFTRKEKILKNNIDSNGYNVVVLHKKGIRKTRTVHQLVSIAFLNHMPNGRDLVINHKNFIKTDNIVTNLEIVTARENGNKKHLKSTSKYTGVSWHKRDKIWHSQIHINGENKHIGYFKNEIDASIAYQKELNNLNL